MNIEKSVVLVTGANRGLGVAMVDALISKNVHRVYATGRSQAQLDGLVSRYGSLITPLVMDVTNTNSINEVADIASDITMLINNAGVFSDGTLLDASPEIIRRDMEVNYFGTLNVVRALAPIIEKNNGGAIVNILSISALASVPNIGSYSASKAAGQSLTQSIRSNLSPKGISVHGVFPGPIDTDMTSSMDIQKSNPLDVSNAILDGIEAGEEDIFPDGMSRQGGMSWRSDPKVLERQLAAT